jgi:hypothetical protein
LRHTLCLDLYDQLLGLEPGGWIGRTRRHLSQQLMPGQQEESHPARRTHSTSPVRDLRDYVGTYRHPGYGWLTVSLEHNRLVARLGPVRYRLRMYQGDGFGITEQGLDGPPHRAAFSASRAGVVTRLAVRFEPKVADIIFRRVRQTGQGTAQ